MVTDVEKYEAVADHDAVSTDSTGARLDDASRDELADSIGDKLAAALDGEPPIVTPKSKNDESVDDEPVDDEPVDDKPTDDDDDEPKDDESVDDEPVDDDVKPADDEEAVVGDDKKSTPTLPEAYRRSLRAYGWEEAEIDSAMNDNAEGFTLTAMKIHRTRNEEISKFAEIGRKARQTATVATEPESGDVTQKSFHAIDRDKLVEQYGNEEIIDALIGPMQERIAVLDELLPEVRESAKQARQSRQDTLGTAIDTFFESPEMVPFADLYGDKTARTPAQKEKFDGVLELADAIIYGAAGQGRSLTFEDAMESAHADISKGFTQKVVRSEIKETVKAREKSISLKPSHGGKATKSGGKPNTRKQLERKTKTALAKVFR